jgi:tetratricopeptide (TPR) repeat protein
VQTLMNIGSVRLQQGRADLAAEDYAAALALQRAALGDAHPETATMRANLGTAYAQLGRLGPALEEFQAALAVQRAVLGEGHPETAKSAMCVAAVQQLQAQAAAAQSQ